MSRGLGDVYKRQGIVNLLNFNDVLIKVGDYISVRYKSLISKYMRNVMVIGFTEKKLATENKVLDIEKVTMIKKR